MRPTSMRPASGSSTSKRPLSPGRNQRAGRERWRMKLATRRGSYSSDSSSGSGTAPSVVLLHRRPQAVLVEPEDVELALLAGAVGDDRPALEVHVEHELGRLLLAVAEQLLEDERDIAHEVDGVVPDEHDPRDVGLGERVADRLVDLDRGGRHAGHSGGWRSGRDRATPGVMPA